MARHATSPTNFHSITRTFIPVVYSLLLLFFIWPASGASAGSATLTWDPPIDSPDIYEYKVYCGQVSRYDAGFSDYEYSEFAGNSKSYVVEDLGEGIIYYFAVTAMDISGNESTYSDEVYCTISTGNENQSPIAVFNADIQAGTVPLVVNFDASGSHDADGGIVEYSWRFGNGETGEGIYVSHTYVQPGQYTAELTVTDEDGATDTTSVVITVRDPFAPPEVIVDNGEAGTSSTGNWQVSGGPDPYGDSSLYSKTAGATYSFDAALHGTHEVSLWWTEWPSRSTNVPVEIYDGNTLLDTVLVNQTAQGGQWNVLGTYNFAGTARITIVSEGTYSTCADAVKFNPIATTELIVDNGEAGTSSTGSWKVSGGPDPYGNGSLYSKTAGATYSFDAALHGTYEVSLWWTEWPSRSTSVPVEIYDGDTLLDTVLVNQTAQGGQWNVLGTYNFAGTARVTIDSEGSSHSTCADAVKFNPIVIVDNGEAGTSSTGSWPVSGGPDPYGNSSLYSKTAGAIYSFDAALHGTHEVSLWWTEWKSRSTSVPVEIYDGNTLLDTVLVNQTAQGGQWNVLGTYNFAGTARVTIVSEDSSYSTCADAVKFLSADIF
jgi:PKD repeat protein